MTLVATAFNLVEAVLHGMLRPTPTTSQSDMIVLTQSVLTCDTRGSPSCVS